MATGISSHEKIPEGDYSFSHRTPPPVPGGFPSPPPPLPQSELLHEPTAARTVTSSSSSAHPPHGLAATSEAGSIHSTSDRPHRRKGSFSSLLRRSSREQSSSRQPQQGEVPPVPNLPATRIAQAHQAAQVQHQHHQSNASDNSSTGYNERANSISNTARKVSSDGGRSMLRKSSKMKQQERERLEQERIARQNAPAPRLQGINPLPGIASFGGDDNQHNNNNAANFSRPAQQYGGSSANNMPGYNGNSSSSPAYAVRSGASPPGTESGEYVERHESMTNRGRYSYASSTVGVSVSSPRRVRRRKDPTPFNVLVIGAKNSGKTSFISFLRHSLALPSAKPPSSEPDSTVNASKSSFTSHYLETEMEGERVGLTLWDSAGLEKNIVDLQLREMSTFVESKFEETFLEEQKVMRSPGVKDTHIHCVFLVLDPVRLDATVVASQSGTASLANVSGLDDDLDLQVMRSLWGKTTVIPVVSKADTLTIGHMNFLKRAVWHSVRTAKMDPLEALELEDEIEEEDEDEDESSDYDRTHDNSDSDSDPPPAPKAKKNHRRTSSLTATQDDETPYIPMSILSPDPYDLPPYVPKSHKMEKVGRRFPWGFADPYNAEHCDFTRLRDSIFLEWRGELRELSRSKWYENWRTSRLRNLPGSKQRIKGGVTPVGSIPREGRVVSPTGSNGVPRSVSGNAVGLSKAERMMGMSPGEGVNGGVGAERMGVRTAGA